MRVRPIDYLLGKIWPAWCGCGYEPLTFILSPCSRGEAKILRLLVRLRFYSVAVSALIYASQIERSDRTNRDRGPARLGPSIYRILAHFADQTFGAWRRRAHNPRAGKTACALSACAN